jgi:hypothetical protein
LILVCQSCHSRIHKCMDHNSKDITFNEYKTDLYLNGIIKSRGSLFFYYFILYRVAMCTYKAYYTYRQNETKQNKGK